MTNVPGGALTSLRHMNILQPPCVVPEASKCNGAEVEKPGGKQRRPNLAEKKPDVRMYGVLSPETSLRPTEMAARARW